MVDIHYARLEGFCERHFSLTLLSNRRHDEGDGVYTKQRLPCEAYTSFEHLHAWHFSKVIIIIVS
jgi:hypothetical protein